jgi:DnaJ homolog subfamily C member 25
VKRAYRSLSRKFHPDKNLNDPEASRKFIEIADAYEILGDGDSRRAYDYYLEHPDEFLRNKYNYYRYRYAPKTDLRLVLLGFVLVISCIQYVSQVQQYRYVRRVIRFDPRVLKKANQIVRDKMKSTKSASAKKSKKNGKSRKEELELAIDQVVNNNVELNGGYGAEPSLRNTFVVWIVLSPYKLVTTIYFYMRWIVLFKILRKPYDNEAKSYLTYCALYSENVKERAEWNYMNKEKQLELIKRELWKPENMVLFKKEKMESLKEVLGEGRYKQYLRYKRKHG